MSISVGPANKIGDSVNAYYVYSIESNVTSNETCVVDRRYSDFLWLHNQLSKQRPGCIIPPLPGKMVSLLQDTEFLEHRRERLERFLVKIMNHEELNTCVPFKSFLECSSIELTTKKNSTWGRNRSLSNHRIIGRASTGSLGDQELEEEETDEIDTSQVTTRNSLSIEAVSNRKQALNNWFGKAYQKISENGKIKTLAAKAGRNVSNGVTIEDPEFDAVLEYISNLYRQAKVLHTKVVAANKQNQLTAGSYCDLVECLNTFADIEENAEREIGHTSPSKSISTQFSAVMGVLDANSRHIDTAMSNLCTRMEDFVAWVRAVLNAVTIREDRRFVLQAKIVSAQKSGGQLEGDLELQNARKEFDTVHMRVMKEVAQFQHDKGVELHKMFKEYLKLEAKHQSIMNEMVMESLQNLQTPMKYSAFEIGEEEGEMVLSNKSPERNNSDNEVSKDMMDQQTSNLVNDPAYSDVLL